ncbi:MAG TPA: DUF1461 domain-containing protein [Candidatus Limnocylindrales bacterium]|nr:DUF1461 domain-containing protein [Candidatus Limnocylindrales bacterium]
MSSPGRTISAEGMLPRVSLAAWRPALVGAAVAIVIVAAAVLVVFQRPYIHAALDSAGSAAILGIAPGEARAISDRTIDALWGGGDFLAVRAAAPGCGLADCTGSFYGRAEAAHLGDVRVVLFGFLALAAAAFAFLVAALVRWRREAWFWRAVASGAALLALVFAGLGLFFLLAFDIAFELFHRVFFPGGNWAFDPATQRLVQLYPIPFWQLTSGVLGGLVIAGGAATWWLARRASWQAAQTPPARASDAAGRA